ncbi:MAG: hypothetical protein ACQEXJ_01390 [Myxococcota bacterium]
MRSSSIVAVVAVVAGGLLASGADASAKPAPVPGMHLLGYRVIVEPEIVEGRHGRLKTEALVWRLRSVYARRDGRQILVRPAPPRGRMASLRDRKVHVDRRWERGDFARQSRLFRSRRKAVRRFAGLRRSPDITLLGEPLWPSVDVPKAPPHGHPHPHPRPEPRPPVPEPRPEPEPEPTCQAVLLEKGHHPMHLDSCEGVDDRCAVALLRGGHHPQHLDSCEGVDAFCAERVLAHDHHPQQLDECKPGLPPRCVETLLARGHHPMHLDECAGVSEACAVEVLEQGHHPMHLDNCR